MPSFLVVLAQALRPCKAQCDRGWGRGAHTDKYTLISKWTGLTFDLRWTRLQLLTYDIHTTPYAVKNVKLLLSPEGIILTTILFSAGNQASNCIYTHIANLSSQGLNDNSLYVFNPPPPHSLSRQAFVVLGWRGGVRGVTGVTAITPAC